MEITKKCNKCREIKPLSMFHKHKPGADGHLNTCKECKREQALARYHEKAQNPEFLAKEAKRKRKE
jgi:hypothetical protein